MDKLKKRQNKVFVFFCILFLYFAACSQKPSALLRHQTINLEMNKPILTTQLEEESNDEDFAEEDDDFGDEFDNEFSEDVVEGSDPLESYNRVMTSFNHYFYLYVLYPTINGYRYITPKPVQSGIGNFFDNLLYPIRLVGNILQAEFQDSAIETGRFLINSTIGLLGIFDPADAWFGLEQKDEDIGQAIGFWGIGAGPHLVLPFLGPSNLRDTTGLVGDDSFDIISQFYKDPYARYGIIGFRTINAYALEKIGYPELIKGQFDIYLLLKEAYELNRNNKIKK